MSALRSLCSAAGGLLVFVGETLQGFADNGAASHNNHGSVVKPRPASGPAPAQEAAPAPRPITDDPDSWPTSGTGARPEAKARELNDTDWEICDAVLAAGRWDELSGAIMDQRGLSQQQVRGMKAVRTRAADAAA